MGLWDEFLEAVEKGKAEEASKKAGSEDGVRGTLVETSKAIGKSVVSPLAWLGDLVPWEEIADAIRGAKKE